MSISIKTAREIEKMRRAGELLEKVHDELGRAIHPGMSTWEINKLGEEMIRSFGCTPNFLNYNGYPAFAYLIPSKKAWRVTSTSFLASGEISPTACVRAASEWYPL